MVFFVNNEVFQSLVYNKIYQSLTTPILIRHLSKMYSIIHITGIFCDKEVDFFRLYGHFSLIA